MDEKTLRRMGTLGVDICSLWMEAASVVWLRSQKLAQGGAQGAAEAGLMVTEKLAAQQELMVKLTEGKLGRTPLTVTAGMTRHYLSGVRANRRRLSR